MNKDIKNKISELQILLSNEYSDKVVTVSISENPDLIIKFVVLSKLKNKVDNVKKAIKTIKKEGRKVKKDFIKSTKDIDKQFRNFDPMKDFKLDISTRL